MGITNVVLAECNLVTTQKIESNGVVFHVLNCYYWSFARERPFPFPILNFFGSANPNRLRTGNKVVGMRINGLETSDSVLEMSFAFCFPMLFLL